MISLPLTYVSFALFLLLLHAMHPLLPPLSFPLPPFTPAQGRKTSIVDDTILIGLLSLQAKGSCHLRQLRKECPGQNLIVSDFGESVVFSYAGGVRVKLPVLGCERWYGAAFLLSMVVGDEAWDLFFVMTVGFVCAGIRFLFI